MRKSLLSSTLHVLVAGAAALACFQQPAFASEPGKDVSQEISESRDSFTSADLYTVPTTVTGRFTMREKDVVGMGCHYHVTAKEDLTALIDVLVKAQFRAQPEDHHQYDVHTVVYLHSREGKDVTLALSPEYTTVPAKGQYMGGETVAARMGFGQDLVNWKKERTTGQGSELMCHGQ